MGKKRNFLVIPSNKIKSWIKDKDILVSEKKKSYDNQKLQLFVFLFILIFKKKMVLHSGAKTDKKN